MFSVEYTTLCVSAFSRHIDIHMDMLHSLFPQSEVKASMRCLSAL